MAISRREFLKIMGGTTAAIAFPGVIIQGCKRALERASARTPVIWIQAQSCSGCSVSLLNSLDPDIATVVTQYISLNFHQTLMGGTGHVAINVIDEAVKKARNDYVLVVEGSIPTKDDMYCTLGMLNGHHVGVKKWVTDLARNAKVVLTAGTCSAFGGIPAAEIRANGDNPTGAKSVAEILGDNSKIINIPGCPPHPDWMIGTIMHLILKGTMPELDEHRRPKIYFGKTVHEQCEHLSAYKRGIFAQKWGDPGCLYKLGCLGMDTGCDIPRRKWVGVNSCTGSGSGCIGCTEKPFPDYGNRGIYKHLTASLDEINRIENAEIRQAVLNLRNGGSING